MGLDVTHDVFGRERHRFASPEEDLSMIEPTETTWEVLGVLHAKTEHCTLLA